MLNRFFLSAVVALSFVATAAQAQMARYCQGQVLANSFYSNIQSNGSRSTVSYFTQLQNASADPVRYTLRFTAPHIFEAQNGSGIARLEPYQQVTVLLGRQSFNNPSGSGLLSQADMIRYSKVVCPR